MRSDFYPGSARLGRLRSDPARVFRELHPLIKVSATTLPDLEKVLNGAEPLFQAAHVFLSPS